MTADRRPLYTSVVAGVAIAVGQTVIRGRIDLGSPFRATLAATIGLVATVYAISIWEQIGAEIAARPDQVYYLRDREGLLLRVGITDDWERRAVQYFDGEDDESQPGLSARVDIDRSGPIRCCWTRGQAVRIERRRIRAITASLWMRPTLAPQLLANDQHLIERHEWDEMAVHGRVWLAMWATIYAAESVTGPNTVRWTARNAAQATPTPIPHQAPIDIADNTAETHSEAYEPVTARTVATQPIWVTDPAPPPPPSEAPPSEPVGDSGRWDLGDGIWAHTDLDGTIIIGPVPAAPPAGLPIPPPTGEGFPGLSVNHLNHVYESASTDGPPEASDQLVSDDSLGDSPGDSQVIRGEAALVTRITELRGAGESLRSIASILGVSYSAIQRALKRRLDGAADDAD